MENRLEEALDESFEVLSFVVSDAHTGERLDVFLAAAMEISRSAAAGHIEDGRVQIDGRAVDKKRKVKTGESISVEIPEPTPTAVVPQNIPLDVRYEDDDLVVINKAKGMVVHPAPGNPDGTLVNAILYHCGDSLSGIGGEIRPGIVHRIDKDTSGLLVVAKNDFAHRILSDALKVHDVSRIYTAVAVGRFREAEGTVNAPIGRHPADRKKMAVLFDPSAHAREAVTHYTVLAEYRVGNESFSLIRCVLETGRTHQIRVHMAHLGHPLLGDPLYGGDKTRFEATHRRYFLGQMLHAGSLSFVHPRKGTSMTIEAPPPENFSRVLQILADTAEKEF